MHPEPPVTTASAPVPPDSIQALEAHLDDTMAMAEIAANAQRDEEAGTPPPSSPARQEAQTPGSEEDDEDEDEEEAEATPAAAQAAPAAEATEEPPKYSRRDAARFAEQSQKFEKEAAEARQIAEQAQAELNAARASDQHILTQLAEVSGFVREPNGRTKYENLSDKVIRGTATDQERQTVAEMTQWHELAKPIYRQAEQQVTRAFATDWNALKDLPGVGDKGMGKLNQAANGVAGAKVLHELAYSAGKADAAKESEATITRLKAELKSAKVGVVAHSPQPAVANGAAVPSGSWRDRAFKSDGTLNEDFDREVRAGKWLGVDLSAS